MAGKLNSVYRTSMVVMDRKVIPLLPERLHNYYHGATGPKTVFFWAPLFKWGLVIAGLGDLARPADQLSIAQSGSLLATGLIWSRYSLVIIPKNYSLFSVNVFVALTQIIQMGRAYNQSRLNKEVKVNATE